MRWFLVTVFTAGFCTAAPGFATPTPAPDGDAVRWHAGGILNTASQVDDLVFASPSIAGYVTATQKNLTLSWNGSTTDDGRKSYQRLGFSYGHTMKTFRLTYAMGLSDYSHVRPLAVSHRLTAANRWAGFTYDVGLSYQSLDVGRRKDIYGLQADIGRPLSKKLNLSAGLADYRPRDQRGYQTARVSLSYVVTPGTSLTSTLQAVSNAGEWSSRNRALSVTLSQRFW